MDVKEESCDGGGARCRCCYTEQDSKIGPNPELELTYKLLRETFDIKLPQSRSGVICNACTGRIRDASDFKRLVRETERRFTQLSAGGSRRALAGHKSNDRDGSDVYSAAVIASSMGLNDDMVLKQELVDEAAGEVECAWDTDYLDHDYYVEDLPTIDKVKKETPRSDTTPMKSKKNAADVRKVSKMSTFARLLKKPMKLSNSINTIKTLAGQPLSTTRSAIGIAKTINRPKLTGKLLTASKSSALVSKLLNVKAEAGASARRSSLNVDSILKALSGKKSILKPLKYKKSNLEERPPNKLLRWNVDALDVNLMDRRSERQIVKHNVIAVVKHTTAVPFINFRGNFRCFYCSETFFSYDPLAAHVAEVHNDTRSVARKIYTFKDIVHIDITELKCRRCGKDFPDVDNIKDHLVKEHKVKIHMKHKDDVIQFKLKGLDTFKCHLCPEEFHVFRNLSLHMNAHFPNYMCEVCGKSFISHKRCLSHEKSHQTGTYPCSKCDKIFNSATARNQHTLEHRITKYRCPQCPERFNKYLDRTVHMSEVHNFTQKFRCPFPSCTKEFIHKPQLSAHVRTHGPKEKKVECSECGMRFVNNYALSKHVVSHTGERAFQCKVCGKRYGRKNTLREHMRIHENDRRHVCTECGQGFVQKCSLNGHIKSRHPHVVIGTALFT